MSELLSISDLSLSYDGPWERKNVLEIDSWKVQVGQVIQIQGKSGSGKTSLIHMLIGLKHVNSILSNANYLKFEGVELSARKDWEKFRQRNIWLVPQHLQKVLTPLKSVRWHFKEFIGFSSSVSELKLIKLLKEFGLSDIDINRPAERFSTGEQQRIFIAFGLLKGVEIILIDEGFTGLDHLAKKTVSEHLQRYTSRNKACIICISHENLNQYFQTIDTYHLIEGRLVSLDPNSVNYTISREKKEESEYIYEINGLTFSYVNKPIFNNFNIRIPEGVTGILGKSGLGKSTLLKLMMGLIPFKVGAILYRSKSISTFRMQNYFKEVQYLMQDPEYSLPDFKMVRKLLNDVSKSRHPGRSEIWHSRRILGLFHVVDLKEAILNQLLVQCSGGEKQRISIVRALLVDPQVLLMDESFASLDSELSHRIMHHLTQSCKLNIIFVSHNLDLIESFCTHKIQLDYLS